MNPTLNNLELTAAMLYTNLRSDPGQILSVPGGTVTAIAGGVTNTPGFVGGRPCLTSTISNTDNSGTQIQLFSAFAFANVGDYAKLTFGIRFGTGFHDDCGFMVGFAGTDTTLYNAATGSIGGDFAGLHKAITETSVSMVAIDDSSTSSIAQSIPGLAIAENTWYDFALEVIRTGTNAARYNLSYGVGTNIGRPLRNRVSTAWSTASNLPDSDAVLRPSIAFQGNATDAIVVHLSNVSFEAYRGNP